MERLLDYLSIFLQFLFVKNSSYKEHLFVSSKIPRAVFDSLIESFNDLLKKYIKSQNLLDEFNQKII